MEEAVNIRALLNPGERLLWEGRPEKGLRLRKKDWLEILGMLALFGLCGLFSRSWPGRLAVFLLGILVLFDRFFYWPYWRAKQRYAVTDMRVMIIYPREIRSFLYRDIPVVFREFYRDGSGTIWFRKEQRLESEQGYGVWKRWRITFKPGRGFQEIADAEWVCRLIEEQIRLHGP